MERTTEALTAELILIAAEETLRRHGPAKATVVDVARALGVSHGSVYRHFHSKAALREAVTRRWLNRAFEELSDIAADEERAPEARLRAWLAALVAIKRRKAARDPELFAVYAVLTQDRSDAVARHVDGLIGQLAQIVQAGNQAGTFTTADPTITARAVFQATSWFHDPSHLQRWTHSNVEAHLDGLLNLILSGLRPRSEPSGTP